jgi:hypothetical protein
MIDKTLPSLHGCGEVDADSDSDEIPDCDDAPKTLRRLQQVNDAVEKWKLIRMATWSPIAALSVY